MKSARVWILSTVALLVALEAGLGLLTLRLGGMAGGRLTNQPLVPLHIGFFGIPSRAEVWVNGTPVPAEVALARGQLRTGPVQLDDGINVVDVRLVALLPVRSVKRSFTLELDRVAPALEVSSPRLTRETTLHLMGTTEPDCRVSVGDGKPGVTDSKGAFVIDLELKPGSNELLVRSVDGAGNTTELATHFICDRTPPRIRLKSPQADAVLKENRGPILVYVGDEDSGVTEMQLTMDERPLERIPKPDLEAQGLFAWQPGEMAEGTRRFALVVQDKAGWTAEQAWEVTVDSSEQLGLHTLTEGARGEDVKQLQRKLRNRGYLTDAGITGRFDEATRLAVADFQKDKHLEPDGLAGGATLAHLMPRIRISLEDFLLELVDDGKVVRSYSIAHGQSAYPTPRGEFHVADMVVDPTWLPPDSAWAREAQPIAPGPNNPLGTRWIGLNSHVVGIHGTNDEGSIGSRASHGCIRMRVSDVEDLYARIHLGTPVSIR